MGNNANCGCIEKANEDSELITEKDYFLFSKRSNRNNKMKLSFFTKLKEKMIIIKLLLKRETIIQIMIIL